jgi:hypothetical protein
MKHQTHFDSGEALCCDVEEHVHPASVSCRSIDILDVEDVARTKASVVGSY